MTYTLSITAYLIIISIVGWLANRPKKTKAFWHTSNGYGSMDSFIETSDFNEIWINGDRSVNVIKPESAQQAEIIRKYEAGEDVKGSDFMNVLTAEKKDSFFDAVYDQSSELKEFKQQYLSKPFTKGEKC